VNLSVGNGKKTFPHEYCLFCEYDFVRTVFWGLFEGKYSVHNRKERIKKDWKRNTCGQQGKAERRNKYTTINTTSKRIQICKYQDGVAIYTGHQHATQHI